MTHMWWSKQEADARIEKDRVDLNHHYQRKIPKIGVENNKIFSVVLESLNGLVKKINLVLVYVMLRSKL